MVNYFPKSPILEADFMEILNLRWNLSPLNRDEISFHVNELTIIIHSIDN